MKSFTKINHSKFFLAISAFSILSCSDAKAITVAPSTVCFYSAILNQTCILGAGDKLITSLGSFTGYSPTGSEILQFAQVAGSPDNYTLQLIFPAGGTNVNGSFQYTISITDPLNTFESAGANLTGSTGISSTTISTPGLSANATSNGGFGGFVPFSSGISPAVFTQSWVTTGAVANLGITINQLTPGEQVPGPLPLLGAGAAFGISRRLRKRIKQVV